MLVLSRFRGESIRIDEDIEIIIVEIRGNKVRLGIIAPHGRPVHRTEVYMAIKKKSGEAAVALRGADAVALADQPTIIADCFDITCPLDVRLLMRLETAVRTTGGYVATHDLMAYRSIFHSWAGAGFIDIAPASDGTGYLVQLTQSAWAQVIAAAQRVAHATYGKEQR